MKQIAYNKHMKTKSYIIDNKELMSEWDYEKNIDLDPTKITHGSHTEVWWKCSKCGYEWKTCPSKRRKCIKCLHKPDIGKNDLATLYPKIAKEWHPTKNGDMTPYDVKSKSNRIVWWLCANNHEYQAKISERTRADKGTHCPQCFRVNQTSFPEQAIFYYIKQIFPDAINKYKPKFLGTMELDIYIPKYNIGIEYDGEFWHKKEKELREKKKYNICKDNNIHLIRFKEGDKKDYKDVADECFFMPTPSKRIKWLERYIQYLLNSLDTSFEKIFGKNLCGIKWYDINIQRDELKIREMYQTQMKGSVAELYPEISKEWHPTKNGKLTPKDCKAGSIYKAWWKCSKCGYEWQSPVNKRTNSGHGCLHCSKQIAVSGIDDIATLYPEIAKEWHPTKNGNLTPKDVRPKSNKIVWWKCSKCGYEWNTTCNNRIGKKSGCPCCSGRVAHSGVNDLATLYPKFVKEWNYEKNGGLRPEQILPGSHTEVWWKCSKCGYEWKTICKNRVLKNSGCLNCYKHRKKKNKYKLLKMLDF